MIKKRKALFIVGIICIFFLTSSVRGEGKQGRTEPTRSKTEKTELKVGKSISKELKAAEQESFWVKVKGKEYIKGVVEQKGIDVVVRVYDAEGKQILEVDSPNGAEGEEPIELVTEKGGKYTIEVGSLEKDAQPGKFEITLQQKRSAQKGEAEKVLALREGNSLISQAVSLSGEAKYSEAIPLAEKALEIKKQVLGSEHPQVADVINLLGTFHTESNDYQKAEIYYKEALVLFEKNYGPLDLKVANALNNLGVICEQKGDSAKAEEFHKKALEIAEKAPDPYNFPLAYALDSLALIYSAKRQAEKAEPLYVRALEIFEKILGYSNAQTLSTLNNLAALYKDKSDYEKAETLYKKVLTTYEKTLPPSHPQTAMVLNDLGILYLEKGNYKESEIFLQRGLEASKKKGEMSIDMARAVNTLASLYVYRGEYEKAEPMFKQALEIYRKILGDSHAQISILLANLGQVYTELGDYKKGEDLLQKSLDIAKKSLGENHPRVAKSFNQLAAVYITKGDYRRGENLLKKSIEIYQKTLGTSHIESTNAINNLAALYKTKGEYDKAEALNKKVVEVVEKTLGDSNPRIAISLNNLAAIYIEKGEYERAEPLLKKAVEINEKTLGEFHPRIASAVYNLASFYRDKGEYDKAEALQNRNLQINKKVFGDSSIQVAQSLHNMARLYIAKKEYKKAELLYKKSLEMYEKVVGASHPDTASSLANLGALYRLVERYDEAEISLKKSLEIYENVLGASHPQVSTALNNLGLIYISKEEYLKAEPLLQRAVEIARNSVGSSHPLLITGLRNMSLLSEYKGKIEEAIEYQTETNKSREQFLVRNLTAGSERQKLTFLNLSENDFHRTLSLHREAPKNKQALLASLTVVLQRKGRALDAMAQNIETLRTRAAEGDRELLDELSNKRSELSVATLKGIGKENVEGYKERLNKLEKDVEELEEKVGQRVAEFKLQAQPITLEVVQKAIPEDTVLIEFAAYKVLNTKTKENERSRYVVYTLERNGMPKWVDLGETETIDNAVYKLRTALRNRKSLAATDIIPAAKRVDRLVMKPVRKLLAGSRKRLVISPDGALNVLPFAALIDETGKYLIEKYKLSYLTSGRDLLRLEMKNSSQQASVIVADPDYEVGSGPLLAGRQFSPLKRLQATLEEGKKIQNIFETAELKVEKEATEENIKRIKSPEILHIATHGYFLENEKRENRVADESTRLLVQEKTEEKREKLINPLLRSWLFFAGANKVEEKGEERESDSIMTALEAASLDLTGTKLVTLSACDTGVGEVKNGEGVYGMRRALVLAGSESQMMSLWPVSDKGTKDLMVDYYRRLKKREGRSDALQNAQLRMLKEGKYKHPYYWAGFIQSGEWGDLEGKR